MIFLNINIAQIQSKIFTYPASTSKFMKSRGNVSMSLEICYTEVLETSSGRRQQQFPILICPKGIWKRDVIFNRYTLLRM